MAEVTESITIDAPRDDVWAFMTDPDNQLLVSTNLETFEREGSLGVGTVHRGIVRIAGRRLEWSNEVTRLDEGKTMSTRSLESPIEFTYDVTLEDDGDGTRVTVHQEIGSMGGFFGKLADPLVLRMYAKDVRANLERTKELIENG